MVPSKLVFTVKPPDPPTLPSKARLAPTLFHTPSGRVRPRTNARPAWLLAATKHRAPALRCTHQVQQPKLFVVLCFFVQRGVGG